MTGRTDLTDGYLKRKVIHKFFLTKSTSIVTGEVINVEMPKNAIVVKVGEQNGSLYLWALVRNDAGAVMETLQFMVIGTGQPTPLSKEGYFIDTVLTESSFVWHIFMTWDKEE